MSANQTNSTATVEEATVRGLLTPDPEALEAQREPAPHPRYNTVTKNTIYSSHGRPPWYGEDGRALSDAFVIAIAGGSASGKTYVAQSILRQMEHLPTVIIMSQDSFYNKLSPEQVETAFRNEHDFDHPKALDLELFAKCLADLKACKQTNIPKYSFVKHQREDERQYLYGAAIIIVEGIVALHDPAMRSLYDLKIFVQCDSDLMLARRIKRDTTERGRDINGILDQYLRFVKPSYDNFVLPSSKYADIIVPGHDNTVAIELIVTHVKKQLQERSVKFRERMARSESLVQRNVDFRGFNCLKGATILKETPQLKGIYTLLRDKTTPRGEFIFQADRLATAVIEKAMEQLPFNTVTVETPTGTIADGKAIASKDVCGVSIIRSGGPLEKGLRRVLRDVALGSLLIQSDPESGEPLLLYSSLPQCIKERETCADAWVFLLDAQIVTGAAAFMAIRVLLDHGVPEDHIVFATFLVARKGGIRSLRRTFPGVRFVIGAVDDELEEDVTGEGDAAQSFWNIKPGIGHVGDRYF